MRGLIRVYGPREENAYDRNNKHRLLATRYYINPHDYKAIRILEIKAQGATTAYALDFEPVGEPIPLNHVSNEETINLNWGPVGFSFQPFLSGPNAWYDGDFDGRNDTHTVRWYQDNDAQGDRKVYSSNWWQWPRSADGCQVYITTSHVRY